MAVLGLARESSFVESFIADAASSRFSLSKNFGREILIKNF